MSHPTPAPPAAPPRKRHVWRWVLGILAVFVLIGLVNGGDDEPATDTAAPSAAQAPAAPAPAEAPQAPQPQPADSAPLAFPGATPDDTIVSGGDTATLDSGVSVTATPLTRGRDSFGTSSLCTTATIVNGSDSTESFNGYDWKLQDPQGAALATNFGGTDNFMGTGELAPGGRISGDVCFDDRSGASGTFVLLYEPMTLFSSDRVAWLNER